MSTTRSNQVRFQDYHYSLFPHLDFHLAASQLLLSEFALTSRRWGGSSVTGGDLGHPAAPRPVPGQKIGSVASVVGSKNKQKAKKSLGNGGEVHGQLWCPASFFFFFALEGWCFTGALLRANFLKAQQEVPPNPGTVAYPFSCRSRDRLLRSARWTLLDPYALDF